MYQYFWHAPPHYFEYAEFHTVTLGCQLTPEDYPFDSHECPLKFFNPEKTTKTFFFSNATMQTQDQTDLDQLKITNHGLNFDIQISSVSTEIIRIHCYPYR